MFRKNASATARLCSTTMKIVSHTLRPDPGPMRPPRTIASELAGETHDLISGIYQLRLLPLKVGEKFDITISDPGLVYTVPVTVTGREQQKTAIGKVWCLKIEPDVFGEGKMIERTVR